jgi:hypothetical protein
MAGRGRGGRSFGGRGGRGFNSGRGCGPGPTGSLTPKTTSGTGSKGTGTTKNRKVLADYVYEISSTSEQDYPVITKYLLKEIQETYEQGYYVAESLKKGVVLTFGEQIAAAMLEVQEQVDQMVETSETTTTRGSQAAIWNQTMKQMSSKLLDLKLKRIVYSKHLYTKNMFKAYAMIWKQCSNQMQTKLLNTTNYETEINNNPIQLLHAIHNYSIKTQEQKYGYFNAYKSLSQLINIKMCANETPDEFIDRLEGAAAYVETELGEPLTFIKLMAQEQGVEIQDIDRTDTLFLDKRKEMWEQFKAFLLIERAYKPKYGSISLNLLQQYALNTDQYPTNVETARRVLESHQPWDKGWKKVKQQQKKGH